MGSNGRIEVGSPSSLLRVRRCGLEQFLSTTQAHGVGESPSSQPARLGNAAHEVLRWVAEQSSADLHGEQFASDVRRHWAEELARQEQSSRRHGIEASFGPAATWPARALTEQRVLIEAERLADELAPIPHELRKAEWELFGNEVPLRGKLDLCLFGEDGEATVIDYKAGAVSEEDAQEGGRYWLQIMVYAALVQDAGYRPTRGELRPIGRPPIVIELSDGIIQSAVEDALETLVRYNDHAERGAALQLARPSQESCCWCRHTLSCPALWSAEEGILGELEVVDGVVRTHSASRRGYVEVGLEADGGSMCGPVVLARLDPRQYPAIRDLAAGERLRATGLTRVAPGSKTLVAANKSWVRVQVGDPG